MLSKSSLLILALLVAISVASWLPQTQNSYYRPAPYAVGGCLGNSSNKSHHLIAGSRLPGDRLTLQQSIVKTSSWAQITSIEKNFNVSRYERITQVLACDQKTNGNGAYPSIIKGGPGGSNVTIKFKSQRGHGINFVVLIYSRN
ncbi:probable salivary secreted peptide [Aphidius gifuensis]|uniref:probable salivary secreted peptide n=1 Tax=Aphidius gifuensis TaxID=684658 RepID=UPI001CDC0491|nr:probable salivary secreted peptide [Aphidius gifuensis]